MEHQELTKIASELEHCTRQQLKMAKLQCALSSAAAVCCAVVLVVAISIVPRFLTLVETTETLASRAGTVLADLETVTHDLAAADLVISRSGAMTVSELAQLGKACILIPFPDAAYDHQYLNAKELADDGAAVLLSDKAIQTDRLALAKTAKALMEDPARLDQMARRIGKFVKPNVNETIWKDIQSLLKGKKEEK